MPAVRGQSFGDMIVQTKVETPVNLSKKQKELLRDFEKNGGTNNNPETNGFFSSVRELWDDLRD